MDSSTFNALIDPAATLFSAVLAAGVVFWQIGRQAQLSRRQAAHGERLKLKVKLYEDVRALCRRYSEAQFSLLVPLQMLVHASELPHDRGGSALIWNFPYADFTPKRHALRVAAAAVAGLTREYEIVDERLRLFPAALEAAERELEVAWDTFRAAVVSAVPDDIFAGPAANRSPAEPPDPDNVRELGEACRTTIQKVAALGTWVEWVLREMQNVLLADLFERSIASPPPPGAKDA